MNTTVVSRLDDYSLDCYYIGHGSTEGMRSRGVPGLTITDWCVPELTITVLDLSKTDEYEVSVQN